MGTTFTNRVKQIGILLLILSAITMTACTHALNDAPVIDLNVVKYSPSLVRPESFDSSTSSELRMHGARSAASRGVNTASRSRFETHATRVPQRERVNRSDTISLYNPLKYNESWVSPANGRLIIPYSFRHQGISISGEAGDPVFAVSSGQVLYAGDGLRGYGNLIIIRHDKQLLSAYAHNQKMLVKIGDWVNKGQKIATMGDTDSKRIMLYFEVRKNGKPINPVSIRGIM